MVRSADAISKLAVLAGLTGAAVLLAGCVTTQDRNARAKLSAERQIAAREPLRVGAPQRGGRRRRAWRSCAGAAAPATAASSSSCAAARARR